MALHLNGQAYKRAEFKKANDAAIRLQARLRMIPRRREMIMKLTILNFEREHAAATRVQTMVRVKQGKQTRFLLQRMFQTMMPQSSNDRMLLKVRV